MAKWIRAPKTEVDDWYLKAWWLRQRKHQLAKDPICAMCWADRQMITPATEVDHIEPHKGDYNKFRLGKLQSLCARHHQGSKKREEIRGYSNAVGLDGVPIDSRHPIFRGHS